jgi:hypothetical protein
MPKYFMTWEMDASKMPADPKERMTLLMKLSDMTHQGLKERRIIDWGVAIGENTGYSISEGDWQDIVKGTMQFAPYVKFKVYQVASLDEMTALMKSMMQ